MKEIVKDSEIIRIGINQIKNKDIIGVELGKYYFRGFIVGNEKGFNLIETGNILGKNTSITNKVLKKDYYTKQEIIEDIIDNVSSSKIYKFDNREELFDWLKIH